MSRASEPKWLQKADKSTGDTALAKVFGEVASHLASYLFGVNHYYLVSMSLRRKGPKDYLATLLRVNEELFAREVVFGTGETACAALVNLSKSVAKGAWKRDKFNSM